MRNRIKKIAGQILLIIIVGANLVGLQQQFELIIEVNRWLNMIIMSLMILGSFYTIKDVFKKKTEEDEK